MTFLWPQFLWLLLAVPLLLALYVWLLRRKKKLALRYASLSIVREAMGTGGGLRRHIPPLLFLLALVAMLLASARPLAVITLPSQQQTLVLAMDVSGSMRATLARAGVDTLELSTSDDLLDALTRFMDMRRRRVRAATHGTSSPLQDKVAA